MKALFYFLTFRWRKGWRYATNDADIAELIDFEETNPSLIRVGIPIGMSKKKILKHLKQIKCNEGAAPLGIKVWPKLSDVVGQSPEELLEYLVEENRFAIIIAVPENIWEKYFNSNLSTPLQIHTTSSYVSVEDDGIEQLRRLLELSWVEVQIRKGNLSYICNNCEDTDSYFTAHHTCGNCGADVHLYSDLNVPDTIIKLYKDIAEYEQTSGKSVIPRFQKNS